MSQGDIRIILCGSAGTEIIVSGEGMQTVDIRFGLEEIALSLYAFDLQLDQSEVMIEAAVPGVGGEGLFFLFLRYFLY